jgi:hypothetical protein
VSKIDIHPITSHGQGPLFVGTLEYFFYNRQTYIGSKDLVLLGNVLQPIIDYLSISSLVIDYDTTNIRLYYWLSIYHAP